MKTTSVGIFAIVLVATLRAGLVIADDCVSNLNYLETEDSSMGRALPPDGAVAAACARGLNLTCVSTHYQPEKL